MYELVIIACLQDSCKEMKYPAAEMTEMQCQRQGQMIGATLPSWMKIKGYRCNYINKDVAKI